MFSLLFSTHSEGVTAAAEIRPQRSLAFRSPFGLLVEIEMASGYFVRTRFPDGIHPNLRYSSIPSYCFIMINTLPFVVRLSCADVVIKANKKPSFPRGERRFLFQAEATMDRREMPMDLHRCSTRENNLCAHNFRQVF